MADADGHIPTDRLTLTPLSVADADEMVGVLADPALYTVIGGAPPDLATLRRRYAQLATGRSPDGRQQWLNWIVRLRREDGTPGPAVGTVQATVEDGGERAEIAWVVGRPWQGRGYAGEAARALVQWLDRAGVRRLVAHVHPDHTASEAVARRAGLTPTEHLEDGERRWCRPADDG